MRVSLDTRVMTHPRRVRQANRLATHLDGVVVLDPDPRGVPSAHRTSLAAWSQDWPRRSTHRLVIQDDAVVCARFLDAASVILQHHPDKLIAFFVSTAQPGGYTLHRDVNWCRRYTKLPLRHCVPTVCLAMPRKEATRYAEWARRNVPTDYQCDDQAIRMWRESHPKGREPVALATIPCLANHGSDGPSLLGHQHDYGRQALCWVGPHDPLLIDWTQP